MTTPQLNGHHRKTLAAILAHPAPHNVEWHDVLSLLNNLGSATERHGGGFEVTIGTDHLMLAKSHDKSPGPDDMRHLRSFLTKIGETFETGPLDDHPEHDCIVLIDHHEARLFDLETVGGKAPAPRVLVPEDADSAARRIEHKQGDDDHDGGHAGEEDAYYESVAIDLAPARRIVVLSDGKGRSNAGAYLVDYLTRHHPATAQRIIATERIAIAHLSNGEIVAAGEALMGAS